MLCTVVGSAKFSNYRDFLDVCRKSDLIIAADGGAIHLKNIGIDPNFLVGDMDSIDISYTPNDNTKIIKFPKEKDFTDLLCAVKKGIELNADNFKIFGALGERLDHSYANLCVLKYLSENNIEHELIADDFKTFVIKQGNNKVIENMKGSLVSIFSFGVEKCKLTCSGLKYRLRSDYLYSNFPKGISNVIEDEVCNIEVLEGYALIFLSMPFQKQKYN